MNLADRVRVKEKSDFFQLNDGEETEKYLKNEGKGVIAINATGHSSKIVTLKEKDIREGLLEAGIDGVISVSQDKVNLLLTVADCAGIAFSSKDGDVVGLVHAGWKGVAGGILGNLFKELREYRLDRFNFYIFPMIGENYEFGEDDYKTNFEKTLISYDLNPNEYFKEGNLHLRKMILDIFSKMGVEKDQLNISEEDTTDIDSEYPSYRLHTTYNRIIEEFIDNGFTIRPTLDYVKGKPDQKNLFLGELNLTKQEEELFMSDNFLEYAEDYRMRIHLSKK